MEPVLSDLEALTRQAGEILRQGFRQSFQVYHKGAIDLVTDMDHRSEAFLIGEIRRRFPDDGIISEESDVQPGRECCQWLIDPLDGTVNYAHSLPIYCVSLAYAQDGALRLGAVYNPALDECFSAELGCGARLNGEPIHASDAESLEQSLLVTGFPYDIRTHPQNNLDLFARFSLSSQGVRRLGSAALDLCYVAAGSFDGFWEIRLNPWDLAAGALIAREAGAIVTRVDGDPNLLAPPHSILASAPKIHPQMLELITSHVTADRVWTSRGARSGPG
jgi:myo-inositol-1(or 4)-monophosphatase